MPFSKVNVVVIFHKNAPVPSVGYETKFQLVCLPHHHVPSSGSEEEDSEESKDVAVCEVQRTDQLRPC